MWSEDEITKLLDSVTRGYPIGIALIWETYGDIQYRSFTIDHKSGSLHEYQENLERKKLKLVLDGQQRLQSLYMALHGSLDGQFLYFDVLSGQESDNVGEEQYHYYFLNSNIAQEWNLNAIEAADDSDNDDEPEYFIRVSELFAMGARERKSLVRDLSTQLHLSTDGELRLDLNISILDEMFSRRENILLVSIIDQDVPQESKARKSETDVLEIFVRINREGTPLSRSDLIFSMLKLNWKESAEALPEFVQSINDGNSFNLDNDFVIRSLFAVSDLGTKFDIDLLRNRNNVTKLQANFESCCDAIRSTVDFVQSHCWSSNSRVLGGANTLVPFVYYLFHTKQHQVPDQRIDDVRKALYLFAFARPFSRYGEGRLGAFIRQELRPLAQQNDDQFPLREVIQWIRHWTRIQGFGPDLLQSNTLLTAHTVQGLPGAKVLLAKNAPEMDHIFPQSELRKGKRDEFEIGHFANFWILSKGKNQNKSNKHPKDYFADVSDDFLGRALIDRDLLDYRRFRTFIDSRGERIQQRIWDKLGFTDDDFLSLEENAED